jgi:hypothetical protein
MSRPIKKRTAKSYARDIEALGRLRTAILMDSSIDAVAMGKAMVQLDKLVGALIELNSSVQQKSA